LFALMSDKLLSPDWAGATWPDFANDPAGVIAVLPLAATEQHGPHLPLGTDTMIAEAYLSRVRELQPAALRVLILPVQPVGISTEHIAFPGTLTLPADVALKSWTAIGESVARAGIRKLIIVTSHGGNGAAMTIVAQDLRASQNMFVVTTAWSRFGTPDGMFSQQEIRHGIHAGAIETSIMLAKYPDLVRTDKLASFGSPGIGFDYDYKWLNVTRPAPFAWAMQDLNPQGATGDATLATADKGIAMLDHGARAFCELLQEVDNFDLTTLLSGPAPR
jgi:creatinine amidohydrolase